ncbi:MAG: tyrosine phosphatase family protein, partial [Steroidobacteraceae bacterium]
VTLLSPEHMIETPRGFPRERHLRLGVNDIVDASMGDSPPAREHVERLLDFSRTWSGKDPMIVHCWAGISRSTAAAFIVLTDRMGRGSELHIARAIRTRAPHAWPNALLVEHADNLLARRGRMIDAVRSIGPGDVAAEGRIVELPMVGL